MQKAWPSAVHFINFIKGGNASTLPRKQRYGEFQRSTIQWIWNACYKIINRKLRRDLLSLCLSMWIEEEWMPYNKATTTLCHALPRMKSMHCMKRSNGAGISQCGVQCGVPLFNNVLDWLQQVPWYQVC